MSLYLNEREILTDSEGYLTDYHDWSPEVARQLAGRDSLVLTPEHFAVLEAAREYYATYAAVPGARGLIALLRKKGAGGISSIRLAELFPGGAVRTAARYAGLPKPASCV